LTRRLMKKFLLPVVLAILAASLSNRCAAATVSGPYEDLRVVLDPNPLGFTIHFEVPTLYIKTSVTPGGTLVNTVMKDTTTITISVFEDRAIPLGGLAWEEADAASGLLRITTMYGLDMDPTSSTLQLTGFTPDEALGIRFSDEQFFGQSGTAYPGTSLGTLALGELPVMFPDFELSPLVGDPSSLVYVFQTTMPLADVPVPEPYSWTLACGGAVVLACRALRRRARARPPS
jgi:hypothetical protein